MPRADQKAVDKKDVSVRKTSAVRRVNTNPRSMPRKDDGELPIVITATVSSKGQVVIPAALRRKYRLQEGVTVVFREEDGHIVLESDRYAAFYALRGSIPFDLEGALIEEKRREREHEDRNE